MEILGFILLIGILIFYIIYQKKHKSSSNNIHQPSSQIPKEVIEEEFNEIINKIVSGELSKSFSSNLLLKKNERLIFDVPSIKLCEERTVKVGGGYHGFSVRIMKGVSYRFGGNSAGTEKKVIPIDTGNFILTNKRIVFSGEKRSLDIPLNKINTIDPLENGISLSRTGKSKMEYFIGTDQVEISLKIEPDESDDWEEGTITWKLTGEEIRLILEKLVQEE